MKIIRHDDTALELAGMPGGSTAVVVPIGLVLVGGLAALVWAATGAVVPLIAGILLVVAGAVAAALGWTTRETLSFDLKTRRGRHGVRLILGARKPPIEFAFDDIDSISIERGAVRAPGRARGPGTETWTARLRLRRPRRAIILAETQGGSEQTVRPIADTVAHALGIALADFAGDVPERTRARAIGKPIAAATLADASFPPAPPDSRLTLAILPKDLMVRVAWKTIGGPALPVLGLAVLAPFLLVSTAMLLEACGVPVLSWMVGGSSSPPKRAASAPMIAFLGAMCAATWIAAVLLVQTWLWSRRCLEITPERVRLVAISPLTSLVRSLETRWSAPADQVLSVRTHDDTIEVRSPRRTHRAWIHLPADKDAAWAASIVRTAIPTLASTPPPD